MGASQSRQNPSCHSTLPSSLRLNEDLWRISKAQCAEDAAPPPPPPLVDAGTAPLPPPPSPSDTDDSISKAAAAASAYSSPGPYEMLAQDAKRLVMLDTHDGLRFDINKQASPFMGVVHSFWLGTNMIPDGRKSTYTFITQVADETSLLMARVDPGRGSLEGRVHKALFGGLAMGKVQLSVSGDGQNDQLLGEMDFGGQTWTGNVKYGSMGGGPVYGCNYLQAITPSLAMGGEAMYIGANQTMMSSYSLKYSMPAKTGDETAPVKPVVSSAPGAPQPEADGSSTIIANFNPVQGALSLNYKRVVTPNRVYLGAELQCNPFTLDSQVLLGAEFRLLRSKLNFVVDGNGRIQSTVEAKLGMAPGSPSLNFSGDVNHLAGDMKFGFGVNIDS